MRDCRRQCQKGTASVELTVCLPLFVLVVMGTVETCSFIHLQETLNTASYEAARLAALGPSKEQAAINRATEVVASRGITGASVVFSPSDLENVPVGGYITATVRVSPTGQPSLLLPATILGSSPLSSATTMVKEKG